MDRPPPPPGEPTPTEPTRAVTPPGLAGERTVVPAEREIALDPLLAEKIDRASFWSKFGSAAAVLAAILGVIALVIALDARDKADNTGSTAGLRSDIAELQNDVDSLNRKVASAQGNSSDTDSLSKQVSKLQGQVDELSKTQEQTAQDVSGVQDDLSKLSDRVDQVEQAQEQAAGGGP